MRRSVAALVACVLGSLLLASCTSGATVAPLIGVQRTSATNAGLVKSAAVAAAGDLVEHQIGHGRAYFMHVGTRRLRHAALVIALPASFRNAYWVEAETGLSAFADRHGFDVAYGQGAGLVWNAGGCCGRSRADDVAYLTTVVADIEKTQSVDRARIYLVGLSNGGMMAYRAICAMPSMFAGVAVVAGALLRGVDCTHAVVHVYDVHGSHDAVVPLRGGKGFEGIDFPAQSSEVARTAPGSVIELRVWDGGHAYPSWATPLVWAHLSVWREPT